MVKSHFCSVLIFTILGCCDFRIHGASLGELERGHASRQVVKEYIQPILYQKLLQAPGDSAVVTQAKTLVSEYIVDIALDSIQDPEISARPEKIARQATNATGINISALNPINIIRRPTPSPAHVINQVDHILQNVNGGNITGIVDQALTIRAPPHVRQLVNGIMNLVLCNPLNRLWNRCAGGGGLLGGIGPGGILGRL